MWSASKGSQKGGGCHEATDHSCGNGCALSGRFYSCTDQGFGCDRCAVVLSSLVMAAFAVGDIRPFSPTVCILLTIAHAMFLYQYIYILFDERHG